MATLPSRTWTLRGNVADFATASRVSFNRKPKMPCGRHVVLVSHFGKTRTEVAEVVSLRLADEPEVDFIQWLDAESITPTHIAMDLEHEEIAVSFTDIDKAMRCKLAFPELVGSEDECL